MLSFSKLSITRIRSMKRFFYNLYFEYPTGAYATQAAFTYTNWQLVIEKIACALNKAIF